MHNDCSKFVLIGLSSFLNTGVTEASFSTFGKIKYSRIVVFINSVRGFAITSAQVSVGCYLCSLMCLISVP